MATYEFKYDIGEEIVDMRTGAQGPIIQIWVRDDGVTSYLVTYRDKNNKVQNEWVPEIRANKA